VIDPEIKHSVIIGGSDYDQGMDVLRDEEDNIILIGKTGSTDFPFDDGTTKIQKDLDVFVLKFDPSGRKLLKCTIFGGSDSDQPSSMCIDGNGYLYIIGDSWSDDLPLSEDAFDTTYEMKEVFLLKLKIKDLTMEYSTYIGGSGADTSTDIVTEGMSSVILLGHTYSEDFPIEGYVFSSVNSGSSDLFLAKISLDDCTLTASTYVGGSWEDESNSMVINYGNIHIVGSTSSNDLPFIYGNYDDTIDGINDGFVITISTDLERVFSSTYIGGLGSESVEHISIDSNGNLLLTGVTTSQDFPITEKAVQKKLNVDGKDGFIARISMDLGILEYSSYFGGHYDDQPVGTISIDGNSLLMLMETESPDLPIVKGSTQKGRVDIYLAVFPYDMSSIIYSSYYGGSNIDVMGNIYLDERSNLLIGGYTHSTDFISPSNDLPAPFSEAPLAYFLNISTDDPPAFIDFPSDAVIEHGENFMFDVNAEDYQMNAVLTYSIESTPDSDIEIDPTDGLIEWKSSVTWFETPPFIFNISITVSDGVHDVEKSFKIEVFYDDLPIAEINHPQNDSKVPSTGIGFNWSCSKEDREGIEYDVFLHQTKAFVQTRHNDAHVITMRESTSFFFEDLNAGETYYWSVIPSDNGIIGICPGGVHSFTVNSPPYLEDNTYFLINTGEEFHRPLLILDNDTFDISELKFEIIDGPAGMMIKNNTGTIDWVPTSEQATLHVVKISVSDGFDTLNFCLTFDVREERTKTLPIREIIFGSIMALILILAVIGVIILRKKIRKYENEEKEILEGKVKRSSASDPAPYVCDVPLTSDEAYAYLKKGSKKVTFEDLYGEAPPQN
jgi:hypothetical protein